MGCRGSNRKTLQGKRAEEAEGEKHHGGHGMVVGPQEIHRWKCVSAELKGDAIKAHLIAMDRVIKSSQCKDSKERKRENEMTGQTTRETSSQHSPLHIGAIFISLGSIFPGIIPRSFIGAIATQ